MCASLKLALKSAEGLLPAEFWRWSELSEWLHQQAVQPAKVTRPRLGKMSQTHFHHGGLCPPFQFDSQFLEYNYLVCFGLSKVLT